MAEQSFPDQNEFSAAVPSSPNMPRKGTSPLNLLKGGLIITSLILTTLVNGTAIIVMVPFKYLLQKTFFSKVLKEILFAIAGGWINFNNKVFTNLHGVEWKTVGDRVPESAGKYLLISNHLSAGDILAIFQLTRGRLPFPRFFLKQELLFVPFFGQALWSLEMPVMKRYSTHYLKRHPEKKGKDLETTKRSCKILKGQPFTFINYVEGTRFKRSKKELTGSPYQRLLKPRVGGVHMVLTQLGEELDGILNLTILYPGHDSPSISDLIFGRVRKVVLHLEFLKLDGTNASDPEILSHRNSYQETRAWLNRLWAEKDQRILELRKTHERGCRESDRSIPSNA